MKDMSFYVVLFAMAFQASNLVAQKKITSDVKEETSSTTVKKITLDFKEKTSSIADIENIKEGDYYKIVVKNINLNLYKVSFNSTDTVLSKAIKTPTFGSLELDAISKAVAGLSSLSTSVTQATDFEFLNDNLREDYDFPKVLPNDIPDNIIEDLKAESEKLKKYKGDIYAVSTSLDEIKMEVYKARLNSMQENGWNARVFGIEKALKDIEKIRAAISSLQKIISESEIKYKRYSEQKNLSSNNTFKKTDKSIKEKYKIFTTTLNKTQISINSDKTNGLLLPIVFLDNNSSMTFTSFPIQFKGDQAKVELTISPRKDEHLLQTYKTEFVFPLKRKEYVTIGLSFYGTTLYDEAYSTVGVQKSDTSSVFNVVQEDIAKNEIGISSLIHFGRKLNSKNTFGVHLSFGPGVSISKNIKPRLLFGGGFSLGKKQMIVVNIGAIAGYIDRLSTAIDLNQDYSQKPENITVSKLELGGYMSFGYLFHF